MKIGKPQIGSVSNDINITKNAQKPHEKDQFFTAFSPGEGAD